MPSKAITKLRKTIVFAPLAAKRSSLLWIRSRKFATFVHVQTAVISQPQCHKGNNTSVMKERLVSNRPGK